MKSSEQNGRFIKLLAIFQTLFSILAKNAKLTILALAIELPGGMPLQYFFLHLLTITLDQVFHQVETSKSSWDVSQSLYVQQLQKSF